MHFFQDPPVPFHDNSLVYVGSGLGLRGPKWLFYVLDDKGWCPQQISNENQSTLENRFYAIRFGSNEWNHWGSRYGVFGEGSIPAQYTWIGPLSNYPLPSHAHLKEQCLYFNREHNDWLQPESHTPITEEYCVRKDTDQYSRAFLFITGNEFSKATNTTNSIDKLMRSFRNETDRFEAAKLKNFHVIFREGGRPYKIGPYDSIDLVGGEIVYFKRSECRDFMTDGNGFASLPVGWIEYLHVDEKPSFKIEGDGKGPYEPVYLERGWQFGCAIIGHGLVSDLVRVYTENIHTERRSLTSVKIGQGEFTIAQLKELRDYHDLKYKESDAAYKESKGMVISEQEQEDLSFDEILNDCDLLD